MINHVRLFIAVLLVVITSTAAHAAPLKVAVPEFRVTGAANKDELKSTLQSLLASRLGGDTLLVVEPGDSPDLTVTGTYIAFGKVFSLDARVANSSGKVVGRAFEQGESADDIIPAVTRLAQKIGAEISKVGTTLTAAPVVTKTPLHLPLATPVVIPNPEVVRPLAVTSKKLEGDIIRPEAATAKAIDSGMIGQRLEGVIIAVAEGKRNAGGERELIAALAGEIRLYLQGNELKLQNRVKDFTASEKIIAIDSADLDNDGTLEIYVTALRGEELSSRVYLLENGSFRRIAADLPWFFRAMALKGGAKKVYAQQMGREDDYYGGLYEVVKKGTKFTLENQTKLPRFANLFNLNQLVDRDGKTLLLVIHPDNYLLVYDEQGELLWKSSDRYGGSETYFSRDDSQNQRTTGSKSRRSFLEQRITVTKSGTVIIPKNEGYFVVGDSRSFTKNSIYAFAWNGAALDELWHTKLSQNYLADYLYDADNKELLVVEVVKKEGVTDKGASAVSIKKVE